MNGRADEELRAAALEWIKRSPAAAASLIAWEGKGHAPVYVAIGTEADLRQIAPDDLLQLIQRAHDSLAMALDTTGVVNGYAARQELRKVRDALAARLK